VTGAPFVYADTSALGTLLVAQPETQALVGWVDQTPARLVASDLLETELRRMAVREGRAQSKVSAILDGVSLPAQQGTLRKSDVTRGARGRLAQRR